jgi:hypothetical protein
MEGTRLLLPNGDALWIDEEGQWQSADNPEEAKLFRKMYPIAVPGWDPNGLPDFWVLKIAKDLGMRTIGEPRVPEFRGKDLVF